MTRRGRAVALAIWTPAFLFLIVMMREILGPWPPLRLGATDISLAVMGPVSANRQEDLLVLWWAIKWYTISHMGALLAWKSFSRVCLR